MNKLTWVLAIAFASLASASAKPKVEFSRDLAGAYTGLYIVTAGGSGVGSVTARVIVPKSGKKLTINILGSVNATGTTLPIACSLRFDNKRRLKSDAALLGLLQPIATSTARFSGKDGNFTFALATAPGATLSSSPVTSNVNYSLKFNKKTLTITGFGSLNTGSPLAITFSTQLRKSGK